MKNEFNDLSWHDAELKDKIIYLITVGFKSHPGAVKKCSAKLTLR